MTTKGRGTRGKSFIERQTTRTATARSRQFRRRGFKSVAGNALPSQCTSQWHCYTGQEWEPLGQRIRRECPMLIDAQHSFRTVDTIILHIGKANTGVRRTEL
ncbi:hypothetical protein RRG08_062205 [Elysia crispata]|uniref:Uncharacterized protein n=1 Tax=Elysia crispata TaxID=231223 RepID=A0AAE0Y974_9GAST|nr:hypothetical protein RRG08_062205 [Elysia crispata]